MIIAGEEDRKLIIVTPLRGRLGHSKQVRLLLWKDVVVARLRATK